jgi:alpha-ketoglutarate-dependent taurine dioxygenase
VNRMERNLGEAAAPDALSITRQERDLLDMDVSDRSGPHLIAAELPAGGAPAWVAANKQQILDMVAARGWALIRGLGLDNPGAFRMSINELGIPLMDEYGDLPQLPSDDGTAGVFNVTKYPAKNAILFHNEGSHTTQAPRHIFFQCSIAAEQDGETPLADSAAVFAALPPHMAEAFARRGLLYKRNFVDGLDVSWQTYFGTASRSELESMCAQQEIKLIWRADGGLATQTLRPAVIAHPDSGARVFFNQILLHHPASLDPKVRKALLSMLKGQGFPRDVCFGDGETIPDEWVAEVLRAHIKVAASFAWRPGDVVVVDNFAVSHARRPFTGARLHHVILGRA